MDMFCPQLYMTYLGISTLDEMPSEEHFPQDIWMEDDRKRLQVLTKISAGIVDSFVDLSPFNY